MAPHLAGRHRRRVAGESRDRSGHPDRPRADRRGRTRCGSRSDPPPCGDDGKEPERGRDLGQPLDSGLRDRGALRVRRGARAVPRGGRGTAGRAGDAARDATCRAEPKAAAQRRLAGTPAARLDIPDKVFGRPRFIHDLTFPGMLHGRVLRPDSPRARLAALHDAPARDVPGFVACLRDGDFIGVVAETEEAAVLALDRLRSGATWSGGEPLPDERDLATWLKCQPVETRIVDTRGSPLPATRTLRRAYTRPYAAHASIAPSCAIAQWSDSGVRVWSHCQGVYNLRADLALVLGLSPDELVVEHAEGA